MTGRLTAQQLADSLGRLLVTRLSGRVVIVLPPLPESEIASLIAKVVRALDAKVVRALDSAGDR